MFIPRRKEPSFSHLHLYHRAFLWIGGLRWSSVSLWEMPGPLVDLRATLDACYCSPSWERLGNNHGCVFHLNSFPSILWTRNWFLFAYFSSSCLWLEWSDFLYSPGPFSDELWTLGFLCTFHALSSDYLKIVAHTPPATLRHWWISLLPSERLNNKMF